MKSPESKNQFQSGVIIGAVICLVGVIVLLDHMGFISADRLYRFWPMLIVAAGVANILNPAKRIWGIVLVVLGAAWQLNKLGLGHFGWGDIWPVLIIGIGLMMIWRSIEAQSRKVPEGDPRSLMNETVVFGGIERRINSHSFQGGTVTAVFGGIELDLSEADFEGDEVELSVNAVFGGCEIRVAPGWTVVSRGQGLFGGFSDKTRSFGGQDPDRKRKTLVLTGMVVFGGVETKN